MRVLYRKSVGKAGCLLEYRQETGDGLGEFGALERTRTSDPQLRKLMLYPLSYERVKIQEDTFLGRSLGAGWWALGRVTVLRYWDGRKLGVHLTLGPAKTSQNLTMPSEQPAAKKLPAG